VPWQEALTLLDGILSGLQAIHEKDLVHRDLKPENILIDGESGAPKITDLGVAHDAEGRGMTRQGVQLGTPEYMSPEQIRGAGVDGRTDLYAAGILLFELLVGEVPFSSESDFDLKRMHVEEAPDLDRLPGAIPLSVHRIVTGALQKDPYDRPASASAMRQTVQAALSG
jgi:serine/threonine-protein kinase